MQGKKQFTDQVVTYFRLSERVSAHNFYRRLDELLDLGFLYEATQELYSHTGQPSLDPVVFFKLVLIGYLENLTSDRRLLEHCAMRLDLLYFLGYELDEALPWHSTVSRTRQLYHRPCSSSSLTASSASVSTTAWSRVTPKSSTQRP
ncbi:transposase [Hymenobacter cavernae]|uniref:Transposase InsH N-terminal domain-containing protein n=1 Tax=Hymenobacter cavernae TaxID=2044852 RepID=A0ABQ1UYD6_9BACT|nr:transposase [Hymenobacter cavernae]GGF28520.1 hypothetical protein GCM10011383_45310 [Hymenobacter cavernae]